MRKELKKAILDWLFENPNEWNRLNACSKAFRAYIFDDKGEYLIGGREVSEFIEEADKLIYGSFNL